MHSTMNHGEDDVTELMLMCWPAGGAGFHVGDAVPHLDAVICCTGYNYDFPFLNLKVRFRI
jgi:hypothetical protein